MQDQTASRYDDGRATIEFRCIIRSLITLKKELIKGSQRTARRWQRGH